MASVPPGHEAALLRKTVIAGHSSQRSGNILDLGLMKCIDTNCVPQADG